MSTGLFADPYGIDADRYGMRIDLDPSDAVPGESGVVPGGSGIGFGECDDEFGRDFPASALDLSELDIDEWTGHPAVADYLSMLRAIDGARPIPRPESRPVGALADWSASAHWGTRDLPCRFCGRDTFLRDDRGVPTHKVCFESHA
jgi:hypothetical protein